MKREHLGSTGCQSGFFKQKPIQVFIKNSFSPTLTISIIDSRKISELKKKIDDKINLDPRYQKITYESRICEDHQRLKDLGISNISTLYLDIRRPIATESATHPRLRLR